MTYARPAASCEAVLLETLQHLSPAAIQAATGKSAGWFHKVSNPVNDLGLHLADAAALEAALIVAGQAERFAVLFRAMVDDRLGQLAGRVTAAPNLGRHLTASTIEAGEFARVVAEVEADGHIDAGELDRLIGETQDQVRLWTSLLNQLLAMRRQDGAR